jgi:parallel beta-helix repeat protein
MFLYDGASPTITNCQFISNSSPNGSGGGIYIQLRSNPVFTGCTFSNNVARYGGGISNYNTAAPTFTNCSFTGNEAYSYGGALFNTNTAVSASRCSFSGNKALNGGAIANQSLTFNSNISNCLISGNYAANRGGGLYNWDTRYNILNCTISGNYAESGGGSLYNFNVTVSNLQNSIVYNNNSNMLLENSYISYSSSLIEGGFSGGNYNPLFVNPVAPGLSTGGDYRLQPCSPAIDKGDNSYYAGTAFNDLDGKARFYNNKVDLGAYELQAVTVATPGAAGIVYVKAGANGTGTSWSCPSGDLQAAINAASSGNEIWVAKGTYIPNRRADGITTVTAGDRNNAFVLKNGVKIYGGFAGTETLLSQRNSINNPTMLSGDLNGDDNGFANNSENAYHVVVSAGDVGAAVLDGFTVQKGNCDGGSAITVNGQGIGTNGGGGINCNTSSPTFNNLIIKGNAGRYGAGLCLSGSTAVISNSRITGNAGFYGGGVIGSNCGAAFTNVLISGNTAFEQGGGMYNEWSVAPILTNVTITGNTANNAGGAMYNHLGPALQLRNSIVYGNNSGIFNNAGTPSIQNSLVQGETNTTNGNISGTTEPRFISPQPAGLNTGGDYGLLICSPAINAGNSALYNVGQTPDLSDITTELNSAARLKGARVDMGAYEFTGGDNGNPNPADLLAANGETAATTVSGNTAITATASACHLIANVLPTGTSTALTGSVNAKVWVESVQPSQYVKRHYELTPAANAATATARVTLYYTQAEFDDFNAVNALMLPAGPTDITHKANLFIEKRGGASTDGTGLPFSYPGLVENINPADADIVWNNTAGRWEVSFDVTGFSGFFVKTQSGPLPLTLLAFTGSKQQGYNNLQWITADEVNTKYFTLERSTNGSSFNQVTTVPANGRGGKYSYDDHISIDGRIYYRLKMVDIDGQYAYSPIITLKNDGNSGVSIYPNPANDRLTINTGNSFQFGKAGLYDASGRLLQNITITTNPQTINVQHLKSGLYFLQFSNGVMEKFMKK